MGDSSIRKSPGLTCGNCGLEELVRSRSWSNSLLRQRAIEGNSPVYVQGIVRPFVTASRESCCSGLQHKMGGNILLKLNIRWRPIANKYREGKMKKKKKRKKNRKKKNQKKKKKIKKS